jgi:hypothetical protein
VNYLLHIYEVFAFIADGDEDIMRGIDPTTVDGLKLRAPRASSADAAVIHAGMQGEFFPRVTDSSRREKIEQNIMQITHLIPCLESFCEDTKYLEPVSLSLRLLIELEEKETVQAAFARIFRCPEHEKEGYFTTQEREDLFIERRGNEDMRFKQAFLQIVLKSMRDFPQIINISCRKDEREDKPAVVEPNAITIYQLANLARRVGFNSDRIDKILSKNPMLQEMRLGLARLEPNDEMLNSVHRDSEAAELLRIWEEHRRRRERATERGSATPPLTTDSTDLEVSRRSGRPFDKAHNHDKKYLFLRWMTDTMIEPGRYITSYFAKKSVFLFFFIDPGQVYPGMAAAAEGVEVTTHVPTVVENQPPHPAPAGEATSPPDANVVRESEHDLSLQRLLPPPPRDQVSSEGEASVEVSILPCR